MYLKDFLFEIKNFAFTFHLKYTKSQRKNCFLQEKSLFCEYGGNLRVDLGQ